MQKTIEPMQSETLFCPPKTPIREIPLISLEDAQKLEAIFKVLSNATRLRLLHSLIRNSEMRVTDLADAIGMKTQAVSNQLQRLADRGILGSRRNGTEILYRIVDPCVERILEHGLCLSEDAERRMF